MGYGNDQTIIQIENPDLTEVNALLAQTDQQLNGRINNIVSGVTVDSELIDSRHSSAKGKLFNSLDARLEETEKDLATLGYKIYGVFWNKVSSPTLTRTNDAQGMIANVGADGQYVTNDFDKAQIYREIGEVTDELGNVFVRIPKFYIKKTDGAGFMSIQITKAKLPGYYLPWCFWDFTNNKELDYVDIGKYKASLSGDGLKLESKPNVPPLVSKNIVQFRDYAKANGAGYQQLDVHVYDVINTLFMVEYATLNSQSVMQGYTTGQYGPASHLATVAETEVNRIIVANATATNYRVGQAISVGTSQYGSQVFYGRSITSITDYDVSNKVIAFDGTPVNIAVGNFLSNSGWVNGFSKNIAASSGYIVANDGKYPCSYRGIESPWGDIWQFVDGVNITDNQAWVCKNAAQYASNVFASPYEKLGYVNGNANGYYASLGFDKNYPYAQFPVALGGSATTYYSDYYYQATGQRIAIVGGRWSDGSAAGLSNWNLGNSSAGASWDVGGRLLKKSLSGVWGTKSPKVLKIFKKALYFGNIKTGL